MADFLYVPAHKNVAIDGSATGTVDADYDNDWICDGRPGRPIRSTGTSYSSTITSGTSGTVSLVAVVNHNLNVATTLGGSLSGSVSAPAAQQNGIMLNGFTTFAPVGSVSSFTIAVSGNALTVIIGEIIAGEYTSLTLPHYTSDSIEENDFAREVGLDLSSLPPYDPGLKARIWSATWPALTTSELAGLVAARDAQRGKTRPTLVVRLSSVNDAMCGFFTSLSYQPSQVPNRHEVSVTFEEIPRKRWP